MTWMPNIPVALAAVDFEQKHADMLASARGEIAGNVFAQAESSEAVDWLVTWKSSVGGAATSSTSSVYYFETTAEGFNHWRDLWEASRP
jgi:hypothetical protein